MKHKVNKVVRLKKHNSNLQLTHGGHGFSDTRGCLQEGQFYDIAAEVHDFHARYYIGDKYYNSVCFEDVTAELIKRILGE